MATLTTRLLPFAVAMMACLPACNVYAGEPACESPVIPIYTTRDVYLDEGGAASGCIRQYFPTPEAYIAGWTENEGIFGSTDPTDPASWNSLDGLALAIETCYEVRTWPFFPPGSCGLPLLPAYEGDFDPTGLSGREWVMRWFLVCGSPEIGEFEFKVPIVRQDFCPDDLERIMRDGFED